MPRVTFTHKQVGRLDIDTGIDDIQWGYNLNTQTFPTYGGEVVQILSVYIDDLTVQGTCTTYAQMEAIYSYFASYLQVATQGKNAQPGDGKSSFNLFPVYLAYPHRNWVFKIYPKAVPGFRYALDIAGPTWQLSAHVVDDSPDLALIKDGIKALAQKNLTSEDPLALDKDSLKLTGQISPNQGNPDTDPFQTFQTSKSVTVPDTLSKFSDYYNSLISAYSQGDFAAITNGIGSKPSTTTKGTSSGQTTAGAPASAGPSSSNAGKSPAHTGSGGSRSSTPHNAAYQKAYKTYFTDIYNVWYANNHAISGSGCSAIQGKLSALASAATSGVVTAAQSQAAIDVVGAFGRKPYSC